MIKDDKDLKIFSIESLGKYRKKMYKGNYNTRIISDMFGSGYMNYVSKEPNIAKRVISIVRDFCEMHYGWNRATKDDPYLGKTIESAYGPMAGIAFQINARAGFSQLLKEMREKVTPTKEFLKDCFNAIFEK